MPTAFRGPRIGRCRAFTLIELLLALVVVAVLATLAGAAYSSHMKEAMDSRAEGDIMEIEGRIEAYRALNGALPASLAQVNENQLLDPWGHGYQYLNFTGLKGKSQMRKDRNLVPINSDYDLYSRGADGASLPPLLAPVSQDDIIRAGNGGYVGLASDY